MFKRYKLILLFIISFILSLIIYCLFYKKEYYYVAIGSTLNKNNILYSYIDYINDSNNYLYKHFDYPYLTVKKVYNIVKNNDKNICYYLSKSRLITISIGSEELNNYLLLNNDIKREYLNCISDLFSLLSKYNKKIVFIKTNDYLDINDSTLALGTQYNIKIIILDDYYIYQNKIYINENSHYKLARDILKV